MADLIGQRLGQYEIIGLLGEGGMASVYRARQASVDRYVAIKVIRPNLGGSSNFIERFQREAKMVASLSHPHILKVFDYGQHEDTVYLVMEEMTGGSLTDLIQKGPLPIDLANRMLEQIASALDYAHRRGIVHRDLKPQNVMLDEDKNAYLTDFGIARLMDSATGLTQSGAVIGTPSYMSPEQWKGGAVDSRADIYSLGVMLFEMLSGQVPFTADTAVSMMHKHIYELPPLIRTMRAELSPWVDEVLLTALAKEPSDRFGSGQALTASFKEALQGKGPEGGFNTVSENPPPINVSGAIRTPTGEIPMSDKQKAARNSMLIGGGIIAALAVLIGGFLIFQNIQTNNINATATAVAIVDSTDTAIANNASTALAVERSTGTASSNALATSFAAATGTAQAISAAQTATAMVTPTFTPTTTPTSTSTPTSTPTETPTTIPTTAVAQNVGSLVSGKGRVAFISRTSGRPQIYTSLPNGSDKQQLTNTNDFFLPPLAWSTDGTEIAFTVRTNISSSIWIMGADGSNPSRFATGSEPTYSPDGKFLAYISDNRGKGDVFVMNTDGTGAHPVTEIGVRPPFIAWSPDSKWIAFLSGGVWIVDPSSQNAPTRLNTDARAVKFSWSPDSTQLAVDAGNRIYILTVKGAERRDLVTGSNPDWSPEGDHIVYTSSPSGGNIFIVKTDGSEPTQIGNGSEPTWSPDGSKIMFTSNNKLFVVNADGSNRLEVSDGTSPSWAP